MPFFTVNAKTEFTIFSESMSEAINLMERVASKKPDVVVTMTAEQQSSFKITKLSIDGVFVCVPHGTSSIAG